MLGDLFVVIKAQISGFINGIKKMVGITQGAANQVNASAQQMGDSLSSAFSGELRNNIANLSENISRTRENIVTLKDELKFLISEQKNQKQGTQAFKDTAKEINNVKRELFSAQQQLAEYNIQARDQKKALADSRLAAEDNSAAMEATGRAVNAASQALLLLGDNSDTLKPLLKGVSIAMAGVNAVIAVQNLKLRENAVFANLATKSQLALRSAFVGTTFAGSVLKSVLSGLGIVGLVAGVAYLTSKYNENSESIKEQIRQYSELRDVRKDIINKTAKETLELDSLSKVLKDGNQKISTKKAAYDQLSKLIPELTGYTYEEAKATDILTKAIDLQSAAIQKRATTEAFAQAAAKKQLEIFEEQNKTFEETNSLIEDWAYRIRKNLNPLYGIEQDISNEKRFQVFQGEKITKLQQDLKRYQDEYNKALQEELKIEGGLLGLKKGKADKKKKEKPETFVNNQQPILLQEVELNKQRLLVFAKTEEEKAKIINASELEAFKIRQSSILQQINIQKLSSDKATLLFKQLQSDRIKLELDANKRLKTARDKDTDELVKGVENQALIQKDTIEGQIKQKEELYKVLRAGAANEYRNGIKDEKQYNLDLLQLSLDFAKEKLNIYQKGSQEYLDAVKEVADAEIAINNAKNKELTNDEKIFAKNIQRLFQQAFSKLGQDIAQALNDSLQRAFEGTSESAELELEILKAQQRELEQTMKDATQSELQMLQNRRQYLQNEQKIAEATESNMQKLFKSILTGVADFLEQLGIGLIAAALATEAFQKLLLTNPAAAAVAGGAAIVAAAGVRAILAKGVKFADGGIVSGPTLGLVGEYPGASTNPEVIAPLDKLKSIIGSGNGDSGGFVAETRISGRDLAIVLNRYNKDLQRG